MSDLDLSKFPTTRYQGSKRKMLPWIYDNLKEFEFNTVLDAFGGSASVSYMLKGMGKSVTYNDRMKFNYIIGKALIQNQRVKLNNTDINSLYLQTQENFSNNFIEETFGGIYYYRRENQWLDSISHGISNMNHYTGSVLDYKKSLAYYALFQACLIKRPFNLFHRKNLNIRRREAGIVRNFGNKTTWEVSFDEHFFKFIEEANKAIFDSGVKCKATNLSVFDIKDVDYDLVYLDPPYISKNGNGESSNYAKFYHFLEGLANYENWHYLVDYSSTNKRFTEQHAVNDFRRDNITEVYDELFNKFKKSIIVLSYKDGGTPSIQALCNLMKRYKKNVYTRSMSYQYALNRSNEKLKEVLIIGI